MMDCSQLKIVSFFIAFFAISTYSYSQSDYVHPNEIKIRVSHGEGKIQDYYFVSEIDTVKLDTVRIPKIRVKWIKGININSDTTTNKIYIELKNKYYRRLYN